MNNAKIGFIGVGNIAGAIIGGICKQGYIKPENIYIYDVDDRKYDNFSKYGVKACAVTEDVINNSDHIFLTVKPNNCDTVMSSVKDMNITGKCFVSVMAGVSIAKLKSYVGNAKVIRVLPNTPLLLSCGATAIAYEAPVTEEDYDFIYGVFSSCGLAVKVREEDMDTAIAVSSSAPAYYFLLAKAGVEYAKSCGMDSESALKLFAKTLEGSGRMLTESGMTPDELIRMVTSPGGTTQAALESFEENGFADIFVKGMESAAEKSKRLVK